MFCHPPTSPVPLSLLSAEPIYLTRILPEVTSWSWNSCDTYYVQLNGYLDIQCQTSLIPRPSHPSIHFITCSTNIGEGLAKLVTCSDVLGCWVDIILEDGFQASLQSIEWISEPEQSGPPNVQVCQYT